MLETLFLIPHEIAGIPVFGIGWALGCLLVAVIGRLFFVGRLISRGESVEGSGSVNEAMAESNETGDAKPVPWSWSLWLANEGFFWAIAAVVIWKVVPAVELTNVDDQPIGLAIRGYGAFLLCGVVSGIALAVYRSPRFGIDPAAIYSVAPWAFFGGIGGARLFYVIQYRDHFGGDAFIETVTNMLKFTEGGLVVYGGFIGGSLAVVYYLRRHGIPVLKMGDIIVPCMFLGLFFGRVGCLMHGCCWGGRCEVQATSLEFPPGSPVYRDQMESGALVGFAYDNETFVVTKVEPDSLADQAGIRVGQRVNDLRIDRSSYATASRDVPVEAVPVGMIVTTDQNRHRFSADELSPRALPVYPAQIISSLGGLTLCVLLSLVPAVRFRDGTIMLLGFAGYAILRFVLEIVRVDEGGQFGTNLSISQWISVCVFVGSVGGWFALKKSPSQVSTPSLG